MNECFFCSFLHVLYSRRHRSSHRTLADLPTLLYRLYVLSRCCFLLSSAIRTKREEKKTYTHIHVHRFHSFSNNHRLLCMIFFLLVICCGSGHLFDLFTFDVTWMNIYERNQIRSTVQSFFSIPINVYARRKKNCDMVQYRPETMHTCSLSLTFTEFFLRFWTVHFMNMFFSRLVAFCFSFDLHMFYYLTIVCQIDEI